MALLRTLALLLALAVSELHCLPWFINVSESLRPGTILQSFSFNCTSYIPTLQLVHVQPPTTFFNPPSLTRSQGIYVGMVTLSSLARLDALSVNHYELLLRLTCGSRVMEGPLSVHVRRDPGHSACTGRFASPGEARGSRQRVGRHGLNRASLTSPLASWRNHSGSGNSHTWGPAVHSAAPRPGTPACPGEPSTQSG
uniref:Cadherin related family member 4 n=1 Tax=Suricata suricatta TaxID=37032 RepID=A0A673VC83_SURSU